MVNEDDKELQEYYLEIITVRELNVSLLNGLRSIG